MSDRINVAREFAEVINSEYILKIILFGSVAWGDDNDDSDIDILIISNYRDKIWPDISRAIANVIIERQELISAHVISEKHLNEINDFTFIQNIKRKVL